MPRGLGALQREILDTLDEAAAFAMTRDTAATTTGVNCRRGIVSASAERSLPQAPKCA
jgi:hypothetical protein